MEREQKVEKPGSCTLSQKLSAEAPEMSISLTATPLQGSILISRINANWQNSLFLKAAEHRQLSVKLKEI